MTDAEIKNLRDLMRAATPGPLTVMERNAGEQCVAVVNKLELVPPNGVELAHEKEDADFLAAAFNALPGLLDEVERLRAASRAAQPVAYWVERRWTDPARDQTWRKYIECVSRRDAETMRTRLRRPGVTEARIVPLYAGEPEESR